MHINSKMDPWRNQSIPERPEEDEQKQLVHGGGSACCRNVDAGADEGDGGEQELQRAVQGRVHGMAHHVQALLRQRLRRSRRDRRHER